MLVFSGSSDQVLKMSLIIFLCTAWMAAKVRINILVCCSGNVCMKGTLPS